MDQEQAMQQQQPQPVQDGPAIYNEAFPGLGGGAQQKKAPAAWMAKSKGSLLGQKINRPGATSVKDKLVIIGNERKFPHNIQSSPNDIRRICSSVQKMNNATIAYKIDPKDYSIHISISANDQKSLQAAKAKLRSSLISTETSKHQIPKDYHRFILGKGGKQLRELEAKTGTKVRIPGPNDEDATIMITGSSRGIAECKKAMNDIVAKSGTRVTEKIEIEKKYHPFVSGGFNKTKERIESKIGNVTIHIPPNNKDINEITIVGDKDGVLKCQQIIHDLIETKTKDIQELAFPIDKKSHKHIIGPKYSGIQSILEQFDVIVVVPDQDNDDDKILLRGSQANLGKALTEVYAMANSHGTKIINCPAWCMQKIIGKGGANIKKLNPFNTTEDYVKVNFKDTDNEIEITGKTQNVDLVEKNIKNELNTILRDFTVKEIAIPQAFHGRIIGKNGANLKTLRQGKENLNIKVPDNNTKSDIITIEGRPQDVSAVYKDLAVLSLDFQNEKEIVLQMDSKYHQYFFRDSNGRDKGRKEDFENIRNQNDQVNIQFPQRELNSNEVKIRGPKEFVDRIAKDLQKLYTQIVNEHYEGKILVQKKFHKNIIGKAGANVNRIKDECNVQIDIPANDSNNSIITIIGIKNNVERAKAQIREIETQLGKIAEAKVSIPKTSYRFLIGKDGNNITVLRNEFDVAIQFPDEKDKSDQVIIRGDEAQVEKAKKKLVEMANDKIENYHTEEIACPKENRKFLVGKNGSTRTQLQKEYNCTLTIPDKEDQKIQVIGKKADVQVAIKKLRVKIEELNKLTEKEFSMPKKYHKRLITDRHLNDIKEEFSVQVVLPSQSQESDVVKVKGPKDAVNSAIGRFENLLNRFNNESTIEIELNTKDRRALIGEGGSTVNNLQQKYEVFITIKPKDNGEGEEETTLATIKGPEQNLETVTNELKALVTYHEDYELPAEYHGLLLGEKGKNIQELSKNLKVTIKVPKKDDESKDIIKLRGTTINLANAKEELDKLRLKWRDELEDLYLRSYTCPVEVPLIFHGKLIGQRGKHIAEIQKKFDVRINIAKNEPSIKITGLQENVHGCVDHIVKFVDDLEQHVQKDVEIDSKVHYKIIGQKGSKLRSLMNQFNVDIKMPNRRDDDYEEHQNIIKVSGANDQVDLCIIELTNKEAEYLAEEGEEEVDVRFVPKVPAQEGLRDREARERADSENNKRGGNRKGQQYKVVDAPWSNGQAQGKTGPDAFPTLGGNSAGDAPFRGAWGQRR